MMISALIFSLLFSPVTSTPAVKATMVAMPTAVLSGQVTDQSGLAIRGAEVRLINTATGEMTMVRTDETGSYRFNFADPSVEYTMMVRGIGFVPETRTAMRLGELEEPTVSFTLAPVDVQLSQLGKTAVHRAK